MRRLLNENRITRQEALEAVNGVGVAFDALANEIPELQEHRGILPQE